MRTKEMLRNEMINKGQMIQLAKVGDVDKHTRSFAFIGNVLPWSNFFSSKVKAGHKTSEVQRPVNDKKVEGCGDYFDNTIKENNPAPALQFIIDVTAELLYEKDDNTYLLVPMTTEEKEAFIFDCGCEDGQHSVLSLLAANYTSGNIQYPMYVYADLTTKEKHEIFVNKNNDGEKIKGDLGMWEKRHAGRLSSSAAAVYDVVDMLHKENSPLKNCVCFETKTKATTQHINALVSVASSKNCDLGSLICKLPNKGFDFMNKYLSAWSEMINGDSNAFRKVDGKKQAAITGVGTSYVFGMAYPCYLYFKATGKKKTDAAVKEIVKEFIDTAGIGSEYETVQAYAQSHASGQGGVKTRIKMDIDAFFSKHNIDKDAFMA